MTTVFATLVTECWCDCGLRAGIDPDPNLTPPARVPVVIISSFVERERCRAEAVAIVHVGRVGRAELASAQRRTPRKKHHRGATLRPISFDVQEHAFECRLSPASAWRCPSSLFQLSPSWHCVGQFGERVRQSSSG